MMRLETFLLAVLLMVVVSCEDVPEFNVGDTVPVVEAFIYANQPVDQVILKEVIPFGSDDEEVLISGAQPYILYNSQQYPLLEFNDQPGRYYYPGDDLSIEVGENYRFSFIYEAEEVFGTTAVPTPPVGLALSDTLVSVPQITEVRDLRDLRNNDALALNVEWENLNSDYHYLVIENIEDNPEPIDLNNVLRFNFEFVSSPTRDPAFTILPFIHYTQFGAHRVVVYRVNEEYALLYESLEQDSRDLNEPFSNITNGVGIFSAFSSDTVYFEIEKQ